MTILALDIGDKRIGIAVSDSTEKISFPLNVLHRSNLEKDCQEIQQWIKEYNPRLIVAGLPRSLDGQLKTQADKVIGFVDYLKSQISIPIEFWNEWMTTKEAESVLISANTRRENRRKVIDKLAATLILDGYLSRLQQEKNQSSKENPTEE